MDDDEIPPTDDELWSRANDLTVSAASRADAWHHLAQRKWFSSDYNECISFGEMSEKCWREAGFTENEGEAAYWQGRANLRINQPQKALECFERAAERHHDIGHARLQGDALYGAAECHQLMENTDEALIVFESAWRFYQSADYFWLAGDCRLQMGEMRGSRGEVAEALNDFSMARSLFEKCESPQSSHRAADRMASAHIEMGQLDEALRLLRENIDLAVFLDNPDTVAHSQYRLGWTLVIADEHPEALYWLDLARAFYTQPGNSDHIKAEVDAYRLDALKALGRVNETHAVARGLRAFWRSVGNYARLCVFDANEAYDMATAKNFDEARRLATSAARRAEAECSDWVERITRLTHAEIEVMSGHPENARGALKSDMAEQWGDSVHNRTRHLMVLASIAQWEGRSNEARGITERVIELAEDTNLRGIQGQAYEILAELARREGDHGRSRDMQSNAVALFLADGQVSRANELALALLPSSTLSSRSGEWQPIGVMDAPSRVADDASPRSRDMPSSRPRRPAQPEQPAPASGVGHPESIDVPTTETPARDAKPDVPVDDEVTPTSSATAEPTSGSGSDPADTTGADATDS
jgi:tetratricopeptide (TPR) repeat protein